MSWGNATANRSRWTDAEISTLNRLYEQKKSAAEIAAALGRSEGAIYQRISALCKSTRQNKGRVRPCMCCGLNFRSEGFHNRLCVKCRRASADLY